MDYQKQFAQIDVSLEETSRVRLVTALRSGALDIAIVTGHLPLPGSQPMPLWSERILLALLEAHPLAGKERGPVASAFQRIGHQATTTRHWQIS